MKRLILASMISGMALGLVAAPAVAQTSTKAGILSCDVSAGVGLILAQKQTLRCIFTPASGAASMSIPAVSMNMASRWRGGAGASGVGVLAPVEGVPHGALAGTYAGVGGEATAGVGLGANALIGGTGRAFSLQPVSIEGQVGVNVAGGITTVTLIAQP